jgi:RPA family protein
MPWLCYQHIFDLVTGCNDMIKRATAYRVKISDILRGKYVRGGTITNPNYVDVGGERIHRVMLMGTVIDTYQNPQSQYSNILLDDASATIRVKFFGDDVVIMDGAEKGDIVRIVGKLKESNNERFVLGEIVKKIDNPNYEILFEKEVHRLPGAAETGGGLVHDGGSV